MSLSAELYCLPPDRIKEFWPHIEPLLRSAIEKTGLSRFSDIGRSILDGNSLVWIAWSGSAIECAASTLLEETDAGRVCVITACGGKNMERWIPLLRQIEGYAKDEGCRRVRIYGRKGWMAVLDGYRDNYAIMDKELG